MLLLSIFLSKETKSLKVSKLVIELTIPIILLNMFFIILFKDINLISILSLKIDNFYFVFRMLFLFYFFLDKIYLSEFTLILLLSIEGSFLMLMTDNLFTFYLALEIQNLCFYVMASIKRYSNFSTEAGLKYFLLSAFSSSILIFGISLMYGILGTLDLREIYILIGYENFNIFYYVLFISMLFFICGLLFKFGSVPFHY